MKLQPQMPTADISKLRKYFFIYFFIPHVQTKNPKRIHAAFRDQRYRLKKGDNQTELAVSFKLAMEDLC